MCGATTYLHLVSWSRWRISLQNKLKPPSFCNVILPSPSIQTIIPSTHIAADISCTTSLAYSYTPLLQEEPTMNGLAITTASNTIMTASSKGHLQFSLPPTNTECHRVQSLHTPLLSVQQLCDAGYTAIFKSTSVNVVKTANVNIHYKTEPIITRTCESPGLWFIQIPQPASPQLHWMPITKKMTKTEIFFYMPLLATHPFPLSAKQLTTVSLQPGPT